VIEMNGENASLPFVKELYEPLVKYTEWWFRFRDTNNNCLCEYFDGVDGGWDNATVYDQGMPAEGPDLAAHLALQMGGLAKMAEMLGKKQEASDWKKRSQEHIDLMLARCKTTNNTLLTPMRGQPISEVTQDECLINYIPLELGDRLPLEVRAAMLPAVSPGGKFMTDWGLATQSPTSAEYESDGFWRGPIWSPSTLLIFDGLVKAGEIELAKEVADRFLKLCAQDNGFYENYNALTGEGLRDKGYSWTAAGFLVMANWLHHHQEED
jgi:glycogen debranching enzyme